MLKMILLWGVVVALGAVWLMHRGSRRKNVH